MGDEIEKFRELVGDEGASVGQIQAHRRVQESTSFPVVLSAWSLLEWLRESDLNLAPACTPFSVLFPPHSDALTRYFAPTAMADGRYWGAGNTKGMSRGAGMCTEPASGRQWTVGSPGYTGMCFFRCPRTP